MCCTNDVPYSAAPPANVGEALAVSGDYQPIKLSEARSHGTTEYERAKDIIQFFVVDKGLPIEFAIAVAGVWGAESGIATWRYNKAEHDNGYAFKNRHAPTKDVIKYGGQTYYKDQANMMKFGYGKGVAQWSWDRPLKFRDWYRSSSGVRTQGVTMDEWGANITGTSVTTQTAFAWHEMIGRTGEFMTTVNGITHASPVSNKQAFDQNIITCVDAVLRGFENGSTKKMASTAAIDKYTWDGGYKGAMKKRVGRALGVYEKLKETGDFSQYLT